MEASAAPALVPVRGPRITVARLRLAPDERLVEEIRDGQVAAFEVLYDRHHPGILSFCRHMLGDAGEAEDALQQTFLSAYNSLLASDRPILLRPWLYTIARNRCLSVIRTRREQPASELPFAITEGLAVQVERRQDLRDLLVDLQRLPTEQRAALVLAELDAMSHREIAEVLEVPAAKVKALVFQARASLLASRAARETDCAAIRAELAGARGAGLRRGSLRRHLRQCPGCRAFRRQVDRQRRQLAVLLPVIPTAALKNSVLAGTIGGGGGSGALAAAGLLGSSALKGGLAKLALGAAVAGLGTAGMIVAARDLAPSPRAGPSARPPAPQPPASSQSAILASVSGIAPFTRLPAGGAATAPGRHRARGTRACPPPCGRGWPCGCGARHHAARRGRHPAVPREPATAAGAVPVPPGTRALGNGHRHGARAAHGGRGAHGARGAQGARAARGDRPSRTPGRSAVFPSLPVPSDRRARWCAPDSNQEAYMAKVPRSLAGQVVAITGGARGIGRATAAALIVQGARVAIGDIDATLAARTAEELGSGTVGLPLDVTDRASFARFLDDVEAQVGPLDILINNAGIMPIGPFVEETDATATRMIDINVHGVIYGSKLALERFLPRNRGHLVQIASAAGKAGFPGGATYCATKHAVVGLSEALKAELRDTNIDITVVMPVVVNTELGSGLPETRGFKAVEATDVADAIVEALQTARFEVYVPRNMKALIRLGAVVPRRAMEAVGRVLKGDQVLMAPDHHARSAYEARMVETIAHAERPQVAESEPDPEPEAEHV